MKSKYKLFMILSVCLVIAFFAGKKIKRNLDIEREMKKIDSRMKSYEEQISTELPKICQKIDVPITGTYTAQGKPELELMNADGEYLFYSVNADCAVTLHTDAQFDQMEDRKRYNILAKLREQVEPAYEEFLEEYFPEYISNPNWEVIPKLCVSYKTKDCDVFIESPKHMYQYSLYYEDLYILDGESYFLMDDESRWNRKPRESGYSGSYSQYGSGSGAHGSGGYSYSDADDYADEYYEEYMEDGFDYDEAYDAAYDDWDG